jgi:hypothetical protein
VIYGRQCEASRKNFRKCERMPAIDGDTDRTILIYTLLPIESKRCSQPIVGCTDGVVGTNSGPSSA